MARLLKDHDYSLQANAKTIEGKQHPDRDAQFRYLNDQVTTPHRRAAGDQRGHQEEGAGRRYKNGGRSSSPRAHRSREHPRLPRRSRQGIPYGVYDVAANTGWVNVGADHDTAAFAVETIRRWWSTIGSPAYPDAARLLITADGGGSNGYRTRLWKTELAAARRRDRPG